MNIDLTPLVDQVIYPLIAACVAPFVALLVQKLTLFLHIKMEAQQQQALETALTNGINFALSRAKTYADANGVVVSKSSLIQQAANYVLPKVPGTLKSLGITPDGVAERIEARLPSNLNGVAK